MRRTFDRIRHAGATRPACRGAFLGTALLLLAGHAADAALPTPPTDPAEAVREVNALLPSVPDQERADLTLIPALAEMEHPPGTLVDQRVAALIGPGHPNWSSIDEWSASDEQRAVLEALRSITEEGTRFVWAQPYGEAAPDAHKNAQIFTDLGEQGLLVGATHYHLGWLEELGSLVHVESTRLGEAGDAEAALDLQVRWMRFARIMANREFTEEKRWAMRTMSLALERQRDLTRAYQDQFSPGSLRDVIDQIETRDLEIGRIRAPRAGKWAALQLIGQTMQPGRGADPQRFGPTLARLAVADQPLRLFGQAARWQRIADTHDGWYDTLDRLEGLLDDIDFRWNLDPHDPTLVQRSDWERLDRARHALILEAVEDTRPLMQARVRLRTELAGTRLSLAVVGFENRRGLLPPTLFAVRGAFLSEIPGDPYYDDFEEARRIGEDVEPLRFFVPVRDFRVSERREPPPHRMRVSLSPETGRGLAGVAEARAGLDLMDRFIDRADRNPEIVDDAAAEPMIDRLVETLRTLAERGVAPENIRDNPERLAAGEGVFVDFATGVEDESLRQLDALAEIVREYEDDVEMQRQMRIVYFETVLSGERVRRAMETLGQGGSLSESERRRLFIDFLAQLPDAARAIVQIAEGREGLGADAFEVVLTEENFVVYSVGQNGVDDGATDVGDDGTDYLLWPPLLSLVREHTPGG